MFFNSDCPEGRNHITTDITPALHSISGHPWRWSNADIQLNTLHSTSGHPWRWSNTDNDKHLGAPLHLRSSMKTEQHWQWHAPQHSTPPQVIHEDGSILTCTLTLPTPPQVIHEDDATLSLTYTLTLPTPPQVTHEDGATLTYTSTLPTPPQVTHEDGATLILTCNSTAHPKWLSRTYSGLMFFRSSRKAKKDSGWPLWGFHWCRHLQHNNRITTKDNNINANYSGVQTANTTCPPFLSLSHSVSIIHSHLNKHFGAQTAQLVEHPSEKPGAITTWVQVPSAARDLSPSHLPGQTLLWCPYSPRVQSHASTSVCVSKDPKHWQRRHCLDTQNTTHADRNWQRCSCGCCAYNQVWQHEFFTWDNKEEKKRDAFHLWDYKIISIFSTPLKNKTKTNCL